MARYWLYSLASSNHRIVDVSFFDSDSDSDAIFSTKPDRLGVARELWNVDRKVWGFAAKVTPQRRGASSLSTMENPTRRWRWNPLEGPCQLVGEPSPSSMRDVG